MISPGGCLFSQHVVGLHLGGTGPTGDRMGARLWFRVQADMVTTNAFAIAFLQAQSGRTRGKINWGRDKAKGAP